MPYTYYHRIYHIAYTNYGTPIGHPLGPDADERKCEIAYALNENLLFKLFYSKVRRGKRNFGDVKNKTWDEGEPINNFLEDKKENDYFFPSFEIRLLKYSFFNFGYLFTNEKVKNKVYFRFVYRL